MKSSCRIFFFSCFRQANIWHRVNYDSMLLLRKQKKKLPSVRFYHQHCRRSGRPCRRPGPARSYTKCRSRSSRASQNQLHLHSNWSSQPPNAQCGLRPRFGVPATQFGMALRPSDRVTPPCPSVSPQCALMQSLRSGRQPPTSQAALTTHYWCGQTFSQLQEAPGWSPVTAVAATPPSQTAVLFSESGTPLIWVVSLCSFRISTFQLRL